MYPKVQKGAHPLLVAIFDSFCSRLANVFQSFGAGALFLDFGWGQSKQGPHTGTLHRDPPQGPRTGTSHYGCGCCSGCGCYWVAAAVAAAVASGCGWVARALAVAMAGVLAVATATCSSQASPFGYPSFRCRSA